MGVAPPHVEIAPARQCRVPGVNLLRLPYHSFRPERRGRVAPPPHASTQSSGLGAGLGALALCCLAAGCGGGNEPTLHPTRLALVTQPAVQAQSRISLITQPVVQLLDDQDAAVAQAGVPVTVSIATGGGSLSGATTVNTGSDGRATFTQLAVSGLAGARTLTFTSPNLAPVTSVIIDLLPGVPATIAASGGNAQTAGTGGVVP